MIESLGAIAPGRPLRSGLDRILQANMGALIVVGDGPDVLGICSGGFLLDAEFSPQRLSELAKMDGAIILATDASRIARANVHLVPDPNVPTTETGTRHRTAERVARSIDVPVISVSEDMSVITLYRGDVKHALASVARLLGRANEALQTLERYRDRLDNVTSALSALEVEDLVTVRDVVTVLQRAEMVRRIAEEIEGYIVELGADGRLAHLQLESFWPESRTSAGWSSGTTCPRIIRTQPTRRWLGSLRCRPIVCWRHRPWRRSCNLTRLSISSPASSRAATGCWPASPACPTPSSIMWWTATGACRR